MATNPNLNLPTQEYPSTGTSSSFDFGSGMIAGKPIVKSSKPLSPIVARLAAAIAKVRAQNPSTKTSAQFLP